MHTTLLAAILATTVALMLAGCGDDDGPRASATPVFTHSLPEPVEFRQTPDGVTIADPAFEALPGATADYGMLGGAAYQIEMPHDWNGELVLYMHGYAEMAPVARVGPPDFRAHLIDHGYAWGASSFSSTQNIPGRAADETAALWDFFAEKYGRPQHTYVTGESMGGAASHIAAERYGNRFDGALALCGSAGAAAGLNTTTDFFVAAAYVAGITQAEFDARTDLGRLIADRIRPALDDPAAREKFENIMIDLTGGPRAFDREGFETEEETNWRRAEQVVTVGLADNADRTYELGPLSDVASVDFNREALRLHGNEGVRTGFIDRGDITGDLQMPMVSLHTTGDWQVPIDQAVILQQRVDAAGKDGLLVQRVFRDASHCGFTLPEEHSSFEALVDWVKNGVKPAGEDVLIDDLTKLGGRFELTLREGAGAGEVPGRDQRVTFAGEATLDGEPFDAQFLGAVVLRRDGLVTPCQGELPPVSNGSYAIVVLAEAEGRGCGLVGAEVLLWTLAKDKIIFAQNGAPWPEGTTATFAPEFDSGDADGIRPAVAEFQGEIYVNGEIASPGTVVEAYVGDALCGTASTRYSGDFTGYILDVVGPNSVDGCEAGGAIEFRVDGEKAHETAPNEAGRDGSESFDVTVS